MERWHRINQVWDRTRRRLARRVGVRLDRLSMDQGGDYREKIEALHLLNTATPLESKMTSPASWKMTLRGETSTFVPIGNIFSGLFCEVKSTPPSMIETIRKPTRGPCLRRRTCPAASYHLVLLISVCRFVFGFPFRFLVLCKSFSGCCVFQMFSLEDAVVFLVFKVSVGTYVSKVIDTGRDPQQKQERAPVPGWKTSSAYRQRFHELRNRIAAVRPHEIVLTDALEIVGQDLFDLRSVGHLLMRNLSKQRY